MRKVSRSFLFAAFFALFALIVVGTWFFHVSEGWSLIDAFYFTIMTITTVGYGDLVPSHEVSKIITSLYSLISIPIVLFAFGVVAESYFENKMKGLEARLQEIMSQEKEIEEAIEEEEDKK